MKLTDEEKIYILKNPDCISQTEMANRLGVSRQRISLIVKGKALGKKIKSMNITEVYKFTPIPDSMLDNKYEISKEGLIRRIGSRGKIKTETSVRGELVVRLQYHKNKVRLFTVSRLVALTFIPNNNQNLNVIHKDGNSLNCKLDNLMWDIESFSDINHPDLRGLYRINRNGLIKDMKTNEIRKVYKHDTTYRRINLTGSRGTKTYYLHRLLCRTFIDNPNNKPCVNHIDGNKYNNNLFNLEWCTHKENTESAIISGTMGIKRIRLDETKVGHIRSNPDNLTLYQLSVKFNVSVNTILSVRSKKTWKHIK